MFLHSSLDVAKEKCTKRLPISDSNEINLCIVLPARLLYSVLKLADIT